MGFRADIDAIAKYLPPPPERQTFLFSATVSRAIQQIAKEMLAPNHRFINCVPVDASPVHAHVPQYHTVLHSASQQIPHVLRLLAHDQLVNPGTSKTIIFLPTTKMTQLFATTIRDLARSSLPAGRGTRIYEIHSKRTMDARTNTSNSFRADKSGASILISSDVSARGVDYPGVTRVIQVGVTSTPDQYIHRIGRTGRAGTKGRGDLVLLPWELHYVTTSLSDLPLRPLKHADLIEEVTELAKTFDENPQEFFAQAPFTPPTATRVDRRGSLPVIGPSMFKSPLVPMLEGIDRNVTQFVARFDEEGIRETFMSLLGYYIPRVTEMRTSKEAILEGLKAWTTDACGLSVPPHVSSGFLQRVGFGREGSTHGGMRNDRKQFGQSSSWEGRGKKVPWAGRGRQKAVSSESGEEGGGYRSGRSSSFGGGYSQGGRSGHSQGASRGGYSQDSRGGSRGGYNQGGRDGPSAGGRGGYGAGRGREDRYRDAGESGFGLKP